MALFLSWTSLIGNGSTRRISLMLSSGRSLSSITDNEKVNKSNSQKFQEHLAYFHFTEKKPKPKLKNPRKRASKLFHSLQNELIEESIEKNPSVLKVPFSVGDAVELKRVYEGGVNGTRLETIRGVVLGRINRGLATSIYVLDFLWGQRVERKIPLHSPLLKSLKVLEKNFVYKGKRKVKRAKLYYLRERNPVFYRVTGKLK